MVWVFYSTKRVKFSLTFLDDPLLIFATSMKRSITPFITFILLALMLFKVSSFHVYCHEDGASDEIENCELCDLAVENQQSEFAFTPTQTVTSIALVVTDIQNSVTYKQPIFITLLRHQLFGRPPPTPLV